MSMDLARKTFSCEPEYFIAGTNIRIATAVKKAGADLSAHTPVLLAEGKVTPVAEAAKLSRACTGVTAEAAKSGEDGPSSILSGEFFADAAGPAWRMDCRGVEVPLRNLGSYLK